MTPAQAEQLILSTRHFSRATSPTETVVGFELPDGRQLALTLRDRVPRVWLEPGEWLSEQVLAHLPEVEFYSSARGRHKNIGRNAPRLAIGNPMVKVVVPTPELLAMLLEAYEQSSNSHFYSQLLQEQPTSGRSLSLKDEADVTAVALSRSYNQKRLHNSLTNELCRVLGGLTLKEGFIPGPMYDALVENYDGKGNDLLVEVKSLTEIAHVRMAIGQLYSYHFERGAAESEHLAVLLPSQPSSAVVELLGWLNIGLLWFSGGSLITSTTWLGAIANDA